MVLTEAQFVALERAKHEKEVHGEFESECPGYCGAQDTFYVGSLKGVGRVYQQTFVDTYSKVAFAKLYDRKTPLPAADLLNDRVVPFFDSFGIPLLRVLTDRGTEYCGNPEHHEYELYLALEDIDHTNAIESLNMQLRKIIKTRGHFPNDEAAIKLLWLALRNVLAKTVRAAFDWKSAMNQFAILFGERFTQARG
ncbi:integrase core domain protein [Burkholderia oklahomensis]|uniref:Mutator family transposase n=1 Tax=Burkholderia oklahomensis TaxID=342113 RepID=A0AAI8FPD5_9BURK|nr:integrase core domain protein [Burkholderia oklahomensis]